MRRRQAHRLRLRLRFWTLPLFVGLVRLVIGSSDPNGIFFQTVNVPISPLRVDVGKVHSDASKLIESKDTLAHAFYRLLYSHYGDCLDHIGLDLSLEQYSAVEARHNTKDHDPIRDDSFLLSAQGIEEHDNDDEKEGKTILIAKGTATLKCKSTVMPRISTGDLDEIVFQSLETIQHVATAAFAAPSNANLYQSLVKIAFNSSASMSSISSKRKLDFNPEVGSMAKDTRLAGGLEARVLESERTCVPQVTGKIKLQRGQFICSPNGQYLFGMTHHGDLSLWHNSEKKWSAGTKGTYALMQVDGNLVVRSSSNWPLWASGTSDNRNSSLKLGDNGVIEIVNRTDKRIWRIRASTKNESTSSLPDSSNGLGVLEDPLEEENTVTCVSQTKGKIRLYVGEFICSSDRRFRFGMSNDGDLSLWDQSIYPSTKLWSAETCCSDEDSFVKLQRDGNLVVYTTSGVVLWTSRTVGAGPDSSLVLSNNGVVSILTEESVRVWSVRGIAAASLDYRYEGGDEDEDDEFNKFFGNSNTKPLTTIHEYNCINQVVGKTQIQQGEFLCSPDGNYLFGITTDGDLSLWSGSTKVWSAQSAVGEQTSAKLSQRGNLIVKSSSGEVLWTSRTPNNPGASLSLGNNGIAKISNAAGENIWTARGNTPPSPRPSPDPGNFVCLSQTDGRIVMLPGEFICSPDGTYRFGLAWNGDLSLWFNEDSIMLWSADSEGGAKATLQVGGNLVVRDDFGTPVWTSKTSNNYGASLVLDNNGIANILSVDGLAIWTTSTLFKDRGVGGGGGIPPSMPPTPAITAPPTPEPIVETAAPVAIGEPVSSPAPTTTDGCISISPNNKIELYPGQFVCSPSGRYRFGLDAIGDLSLWKRSNKEWSAGTGMDNDSGEAVFAKLKDDGNLVVRSAGKLLWSSGTSDPSNHNGSTIQVHDDGIATITSSIGFFIWSSATADGQVADPSTLEKKVMSGYQGWFYTDSDGGLNRWQHWSDARTVPDKNTVTIDMWPDMREYDADELASTGFQYKDGTNAGLYSAYQTKTVERHCKWLQDYDIDGLFVQRFVGDMLAWPHIRDQVLQNVRSGSEKYGRVFVNMYDIGNGDQRTLVDDIKRDWMHLVDDELITTSKSYLQHKGKPILALWGFGFHDRIGTPSQANELIKWFQQSAEPRYRATVMGGVPAGWRTLSRDSRTNAAWAKVYRGFDIISPWTVGRMVDNASADYFKKNFIQPDMEECQSQGIDYLPVAFPGFSSHNLKPEKPFNEIPRLGGSFIWKQFRNLIRTGNEMIYVAMFDETDEGTSIFKVAENSNQIPTKGKFLTLDADPGYNNIPSDWYLRLTGAAGRILKEGQQNITATVPENP